MLNPFLEIFHMEDEPGSISDLFLSFFPKIQHKELTTKNNELYSQINSSTINITSYFEKSLEKFPSLFENDLKTFEDCLKFLEKQSIPNKCICAGIIDTIPGWRCVDCSKYENSIYCNDCYINAKDWHKDHKVYYLCSSTGMCDCGDPDSLYKNCREHSGPFKQEKEKEDYIQKNFGNKVVDNLRKFFDEFFLEYSKYFLLTSKCELFMKDLFDEKFRDVKNDELNNEIEDVLYLKSNFCIVFENFIYFLRLITKNNLAMLHLIANYFLKNNFESIKLEEQYMTEHSCIEINQQDIKLYYDTVNKEKHLCKCPFLRLFLDNYRDEVKLDSKDDEREFLFSFAHNLSLRNTFCVLYFFLLNQNLYNYNENLLYCRTQFYLEDGIELMAKKSNLIENSMDVMYKYILKKLKRKEGKEQNVLEDNMIQKMYRLITIIYEDVKYYSKPKVRALMIMKTSYFKRFIDLICLFQNIYEFISIVPHPPFQDKSINNLLFEIENILSKIPNLMNCCFDWNQMEQLKEIYTYIIYKILNQKKEGVNQLEANEFSFLQPLYRSFGVFMNGFCFNHSFLNNCTIMESINFFKKNFFDSQEQIENLVDIILKDYFKLFGFIAGTKNSFFQYYDRSNIYFPIYIKFNFHKNDFTLMKYLFILTEKEIDINSYLKLSNIEDVYETFDNIFNLGKIIDDNVEIESIKEEPKNDPIKEGLPSSSLNNLSRGERVEFFLRTLFNRDFNAGGESQDEVNIIMQWELLLEFLILIIKDDSCPYWNLIYMYGEIISSKTRNDLFNNIKGIKYAMDDIKNILQEKIVLNIISQDNLIDKQKLEKKIDEYLLILFEENDIYNQTLDELTHNKMMGETKLFYLKDEYLKLIDFNYFINPKDKSTAQKYILNFKKNIIKTYNYYYYNQSELTFEFFEKVYEKVLLSKNNLNLIIKMIEKLINEEKIMKKLDKKSIRNSLFPIILNYIQMFSVINTRSFIEFKIENKNIIKKLYEVLVNLVNNKNNIIDKDIEDHIKEILTKINQYQLIYVYYGGDLSKLPKFNYNINILEQIKKNQNSIINISNIIPENKNNIDEKKQKANFAKDKLKLLMKKKNNNFMSKIESSEEMTKAIEEHLKELENRKNEDGEIMCFYCRDSIKLHSFEKPYGKLGLIIKDLFYVNTIKATLREELPNLKLNDENNKIYEEIMKVNPQKYFRVFSCGHYLHDSCFIEGCNKNIDGGLNCPICLKYKNILIPALTLFNDKYSFLKSEKFEEMFNEVNEKEEKEEKEDLKQFLPNITSYLVFLHLFNRDIKSYNSYIEEIYPYYQSYLNFFENTFYVDGTTFHKNQQIDNIKNLILSIRAISYDSTYFTKSEIVTFIKEVIFKLGKGPEEKEFIYNYNDSYMHYINLFEKIILSLIILFDYEEIKQTIKYIIYMFLPYFCFGLYFKKLIVEKNNNKINKEQFENNLNLNDFRKYLEEDNKPIIKYLNSFLKRFCFIKIISDYKDKNEDIINNINNLSIKDILNIIDMENLVQILPQKDFSINDIIIKIPETFDSNESFYKTFPSALNFDKILNSIFENVKKNYNENDLKLNKELVIQFNPPKFNFIKLDYNVFDFIEKYAKKNCEICLKIPIQPFICLICGKKVCNPKKNGHSLLHVGKCTGDFCIFLDTEHMKLHYYDFIGREKKLYPLYVNKAGNGPKGIEISNEFNLSQETLKNLIQNFATDDFNLN